ncbi:molybdate ABC transporter substrate-binding protein [uncultured Imperialibacter sp.]|uniref:molybdate ABC transporter substrate-binding protein n=1 Tax=uncultured Imperialibacter sp. TaxID=1672639 RepID=UPI0030DDAF7B
MVNRYIATRIHITIFLMLLCCSMMAQSIKVAVASNLLLPMQAIEKKFEGKYPYEVELIPGASGTLTSQIVNGAPYEIFVSADDKYIDEVIDKDKAHGGPQIICFGTVYLWVKSGIAGDDPEAILKQEKVRSIGLAHPDLAPYGKLSRDWLEVKQLGVLVHDKIVYGTSIGQVNQYIAAGSVDAAFTSNSLKFSQKKGEGKFIKIEEIWMDPIPQTMLILKTDGPGLFVATLFKDFLLGKESRRVFQDFGYELPVAE